MVCAGIRRYALSALLTHNSIIKTNVAVICACLPCLKAFAKHHLGHTWLFRASTQRTLNQALSFLNTRPQPEVAELDAPRWDSSRRSGRSMAYRELGGDQRSETNKNREGGSGGEASEIEVAENAGSVGVGRSDGLHRAECGRGWISND